MSPRAYYNEFDPAAAHVLRVLIAEGVIAPGDVDERSIKDVQADDLDGYTQCHFFAGGGLWSVAARLAGWPDSRPLWTGSCPCQPFSQIGKRLGIDDPRHLWPDFHRLIRTCRPPVVMGEQVAKTAGYGWFDGVRADLESEGYASRCVDIPALAVDAPHERNRLYWIAAESGVGDGLLSGLEGHARDGDGAAGRAQPHRSVASADGRNGTFWSDAEWIICHDGKARRTKPGLPLLADGIPGRVDLWRITGNAISPVLAAEVIAAFLDTEVDCLGHLSEHRHEPRC
jgi:DNA (cytosine-5)-methyltransferase 1